MDKSVRLVIERMKTAKKIKIEFDDMEIRPIYDDKILAHDIAKFFGKHKVKRFPHLAAVINAELTPKVQFSLNTSAYIKKAAALKKQSK